MNQMKKLKYLLITGGILALIAISIGLYLFNMPHRDIQSEKPKYTIETGLLVNEFLENQSAANEKYLDQVIVVSGLVRGIETDQNNQVVLFLKEEGDEAGVRCTFLAEASNTASSLSIGETISVKGVLRMGASIDKDFDIVEHVILEKCDLIK